eukprot:3886154-Prymnesium_polylepis.1
MMQVRGYTVRIAGASRRSPVARPHVHRRRPPCSPKAALPLPPSALEKPGERWGGGARPSALNTAGAEAAPPARPAGVPSAAHSVRGTCRAAALHTGRTLSIT